MKIRIGQPYILNEIGGGDNLEDCVFPTKEGAAPDNRFFILCDGVGGHNNGEVASSTVCESFADFLADAGTENFDTSVFEAALDHAFDRLDEADTGYDGRKMGTTLAFVCFHNNGVFMAHIGDSRIYHLRKQGRQVGILYKSRDHSLVNDLVKAGIISPEEAAVHPKRNVLTRALQPHQDKRTMAEMPDNPDEYNDVRAGDYFFLCSDGVLEQVDDEILTGIIGMEISDEEKINAIYDACYGKSRDNFSACLIPIEEVDGKTAAGAGQIPILSFLSRPFRARNIKK
jgi:protein phosphatase